MEYDLRLDEGSYLVYIEETGEMYIAYDDGDYSLLFETNNSLAGLTYFKPNTAQQTKEIEEGITVGSTPSVELQEKSYIQQLANKGLAMIIDTKENFYTAKGIGDLQPFVHVDYAYSQLDLAIGQHGSNAVGRFIKNLEQRANNAPWWKDPNYRAEAANWYRKGGKQGYDTWLETTHDQWLEDNGYDPRTYEAWKEYSKSETKWNDKVAGYKLQLEEIVAAKGGSLSDSALEYAANEWAWGRWDFRKASQQVKKAVDSGEEGTLDAGFMSFLEGTEVGQTQLQEQEVKDDLNTWLPESLHGAYSKDIKDIAAKYRNDPGYRDSFIEQLKEDRFAAYPKYDKNISWSRLVQGKKSIAAGIWGVNIDSIEQLDPAIVQMLAENDPTKESELLRSIGIERGYAKPMNDLATAMASSYGTGVVRQQEFRD